MTNILLYVTCASEEEAVKIGTALVEERLCACANVLGRMTSIFQWEGKVQNAQEVALILKSRAGLADAVTARVKELHSYSVPCVVALPIEGGNPAFLKWIEEETASRA